MRRTVFWSLVAVLTIAIVRILWACPYAINIDLNPKTLCVGGTSSVTYDKEGLDGYRIVSEDVNLSIAPASGFQKSPGDRSVTWNKPGGYRVTITVTIKSTKNGKEMPPQTRSSGTIEVTVARVKIKPSGRNKLLITGSKKFGAAGEPKGGIYHWSYDGKGTFDPNDSDKAENTTFTASQDPSSTDKDKISAAYQIQSVTCEDSSPLTITVPAKASFDGFGNNRDQVPIDTTTDWYYNDKNKSIPIINTAAYYTILDQFGKPISESDWDGKNVQVREVVPFKGFPPAVQVILDGVKTCKTWRDSKGTISDQLKIPFIPVGALLDDSKPFGKFLVKKGDVLISATPHEWHASVNGISSDVTLTSNKFEVTVADFRRVGGREQIKVRIYYEVITK